MTPARRPATGPPRGTPGPGSTPQRVWSPANRDRDNVTYDERLAEARRQLFPVLSAAEDEAASKRTGRARRVVECPGCHRNIRKGQRCWWCDTRWKR
jgi:hypothetical protein